MERNQGDYSHLSAFDRGKSTKDSTGEAIIIVAFTGVATLILGLVAANIFTVEQMYIIRPLLAAVAVFIIFSYILSLRVRVCLFGEIGFIYLAIAMAYTIFPGIKFLLINFDFPAGFDALNFAVLSPQPAELGTHFWRHVLFISGVSTGFLALRRSSLPLTPMAEKAGRRYGRIIGIMIAMIGGSIFGLTMLSASASNYIEHYTRFDHLSWPLRRLVYLFLIFKSGGYFILLALMFSQYQRYRMLIFIIVPIICTYEVVYSLGSRIVAFTFLLGFFGFYHFRVTAVSLKKGILFLIVLAFIFSGIGIIRDSDYSLENLQYRASEESEIHASEFEAVYCTSFHLYAERAQETLPERDWRMFFYELISVIPFIDHITYHPQYWYARNYFPEAVVPPTTMGVVADSAIWGGESDLLVRSLINGAILAMLTRWFYRRRDKWWALTIYIYCYATCIMVIKYSVLFQLVPLVQIISPALILTAILFLFQKPPTWLKSFFNKGVA
jgi:hypothetical protein